MTVTTATTADLLIRTPDGIAADWLARVLGRPGLVLLGSERIGTGQMSQNHRVRFTEHSGADGAGEAPEETVVVKLASDDETSRATGVGMGAYSREVAFYQRLASRLGPAVPACHLATYDDEEGWFTLVLADVVGATQGDQVAGCTIEEARTAMVTLAGVHAPVMNDISVGAQDFLNLPNPLDQALLTMLLPAFLERYDDRVTPEHAEVARRYAEVADAWTAQRRPPLGLVHGDYRLDNLLFRDGDCTVVDWQTLSWGPAMDDVGYFLGGGLTVEDRRAHEEELVHVYHDELLRLGVTALGWEAAWDGYRRACFPGIVMAVIASVVTVQTERGDEMFTTAYARHAQQVLDLGALDLLPQPGDGPPPALQPEPADEGLHEPGPEPFWNESFYADAVADDGSLGVYTRIGRVPNRDEALVTIAVVGPGRPASVICTTVALPGADDARQLVDEPGGLRIDQVCEEPLRRFRVTMSGPAPTYDDPAAPLRAEADAPRESEIGFDLVWETDGTPYAWRGATRYEIPCRVTGTVTADGEQIAFAGPGQRDHSWGARDWWAAEWMWNGLHLDDGTHVHQVGVPQLAGYGVGYVQRDGEVTEVTALTMDAEHRPDGLVDRATFTSGDLVLHLEPVAWGALRLVAPDGRVTHFPRAMVSVTTDDGRRGAGWVEWNRVQGG